MKLLLKLLLIIVSPFVNAQDYQEKTYGSYGEFDEKEMSLYKVSSSLDGEFIFYNDEVDSKYGTISSIKYDYTLATIDTSFDVKWTAKMKLDFNGMTPIMSSNSPYVAMIGRSWAGFYGPKHYQINILDKETGNQIKNFKIPGEKSIERSTLNYFWFNGKICAVVFKKDKEKSNIGVPTTMVIDVEKETMKLIPSNIQIENAPSHWNTHPTYLGMSNNKAYFVVYGTYFKKDAIFTFLELNENLELRELFSFQKNYKEFKRISSIKGGIENSYSGISNFTHYAESNFNIFSCTKSSTDESILTAGISDKEEKIILNKYSLDGKIDASRIIPLSDLFIQHGIPTNKTILSANVQVFAKPLGGYILDVKTYFSNLRIILSLDESLETNDEISFINLMSDYNNNGIREYIANRAPSSKRFKFQQDLIDEFENTKGATFNQYSVFYSNGSLILIGDRLVYDNPRYTYKQLLKIPFGN